MKRTQTLILGLALVAFSTLAVQAQQGAGAGAGTGVGTSPQARGGISTFVLRPQIAVTPLEARVVKGQPYSAEIIRESIQTLGDGNRIVQRSTGRVYRDTDGRVRREEDRASGSPSISITDPVAGSSITLDTDSRTAVQGFYVLNPSSTYQGQLEQKLVAVQARTAGSQDVPSARASGAGAGARGGVVTARAGGVSPVRVVDSARGTRVDEALANRAIEGVNCTGVRRTTTIPAGAIGNDLPIKVVSEEWTSVDLQVLVLTDTSDPRTGRSTYQLQKINRANPDASLFKVPADYTVTAGRGGRGRGGQF